MSRTSRPRSPRPALSVGLVALPLLSGLLAGPARGEARVEPRDRAPSGRELFAREWTPDDPRSHGGDGLGPVFNARSCLGCHNLGGPGGAGGTDRNIDIVSALADAPATAGASYSFGMSFGGGGFQYRFAGLASGPAPEPLNPAELGLIHPGFRESRSLVLHRFGADPAYAPWRDRVPGRRDGFAVRLSQRNPSPLFGVGPIDAIPDEALLAAARRRPPGSAPVSGRVARTRDGRIGRFGWKAQEATLREFVLSAAATELGLEVPGHHQAADPRVPGAEPPGPDLTAAECDALIAYVRARPAPASIAGADAPEAARIKAGRSLFRSIGCAGCHSPKLGPVEGIYSDLLLHEMGPRLADTGSYGVLLARPPGEAPAPAGRAAATDGLATDSEWRTPPLWGLRDSAPYLHDGRAATIPQAIALHGGQGAPSAARFSQLSPRERRQLESFLLSLGAPAPPPPAP